MLLSAGFRTFFPAAGLWACLAMLLWALMLHGVLALPSAFHPVVWHLHELLFGFVAAAIAGFLLTAIPNWTGRPALSGAPIGVLFLLWLLGRVAVATSAWIGPALAMVADLAFLLALAAFVARELLAAGSRRNLPVVAVLALLIVANALIHAGVYLGPAWVAAGERLAIAVIVALISLIGGRIIPNFTGNWLRKRRAPALPPAAGRFDVVVLVAGILALLVWVIAGLTQAVGVALLIAGLLHAVRLARWRAQDTLAEPLLWILHLGYAWLVAGLLMLGWAAWMPQLASTAIHVLTAGAMGTMIAAVMTRASLGHTGQPLTAGAGTIAVYLLVTFAAVTRIAAPFLGMMRGPALDLAATAWIAAFALFVVLYAPLYLRR
jgi:uncharacterized protein involved in response to NO